jgi:NadR type nicotinamide-nucleotide adenylyltransferase
MGPLRVVLTGSECTGKTTLAAALAARHATSWSREYARDYVWHVGRPLLGSDVEPIARGQIAGEDEATLKADRIVFLDTDLVSTVVYARHYYGSCPAWIETAARERRGDLYLLHHPDVPWVDEGLQRDRSEAREEMHGLFRDALERLGVRVADVAGTWPLRTELARAAVGELLASVEGGAQYR